MARLKKLPTEISALPVLQPLNVDGGPSFGLRLAVAERIKDVVHQGQIKAEMRLEIVRALSDAKQSLFRELLRDHSFLIVNAVLTSQQRPEIHNLNLSQVRFETAFGICEGDSRFDYVAIDNSREEKGLQISDGKQNYKHSWEGEQTVMILASKTPQRTDSKKSRRNTVIG